MGRNGSRLLNFPEALGELMMGIILGNIYFFSGWGFFELLHTTPNIAVPADFGAIILLLSVGLRTDIHELFHTGPSPLLVAITAIMSPPLMKLALTRAKEFVPEKAPVPYGLGNESRKKFLMLRQLGRR